ncbi:MAG: NAD(P)-binding protein [Actinomycetia bacterium]|nr:NAD(P)-binding protein [Actinomycetes bacterium]
MSDVVVIGAGLAGLGAAERLRSEGRDHLILEKEERPGGHTRSYESLGYTFDEGPHVSFTSDEGFRAQLDDNVGGQFETVKAVVNNLWKGHWITHPAQVNLNGLPEDLVVGCVRDFVQAFHTEPGRPDNYADWLLASFGETFARTFPMEYGHRYHTTEAANMSTDWLGPRLYRPEIEEVLRGAISPTPADVHYIQEIRYPSLGGFESFLRPWYTTNQIECGQRVAGIDPEAGTVRMADGTRHQAGSIISSVPLPDLIPLVDRVPADVQEAASLLAATVCVTVNIGVDRDDISEAHWSYFYDRDISFVRTSYPHLLSPGTVPTGCGSVQAEHYYSTKYRPLDVSPQSLIEPTISDLTRIGVLRETENVVFAEARVLPHANVIFDLDRVEVLPIVLDHLRERGIETCGRFGEWGPHWTDQSFLSGEAAAQRALDR